MTQFELGSISTGTLRPQDLLPAFLETLTALGGEIPKDLECTSHIEYLNWPSLDTTASDDDDKFWGSEEAMWDMEALTDALQALCPTFVYFGTLEGDGADFGYWPDRERLQETLTAATVGHTLTLPRNGEWEWQLEDEDVIVNTNDHGSVTVMDLERHVIWSVT